MKEFILNIVGRYGYLGIFLLILLENIFPPIPSEVILTFAGFLTVRTQLNIFGAIIFSTAGAMIGAIVFYILGRFLSVERLEKLFDSKAAKLLRFKKSDVRKAEKWFSKRGKRAVFLCRFVPIVRSLISIPAGMAKMNFALFFVLTLAGTAMWNSILIVAGWLAGDAWEKISGYFDIYSTIFIVILAVIAVAVIAIFIKKRFFSKSQNDEAEKEAASADAQKLNDKKAYVGDIDTKKENSTQTDEDMNE